MTRLVPAIAAIALAGLSACATKPTFVLLPDETGRTGAITLTNEAGSQSVDQTYGAVDVKSATSAPGAVEQLTAEVVEARFGDTLSVTPLPPVEFVLYFGATADDLTPESVLEIARIVEIYARYPSPEISVVGHTDTVGTAESNDQLSLERAETIRRILIENGAPPEIIDVDSHGETALLVETTDEVNEPQNRRVEITIR